MTNSNNIRFATFNVSLNRNEAGELIADLSSPDNQQAKNVAEIIQRQNPDVVLLNEFDYDPEGEGIELFQDNYLSVSQNGVAPVEYPYVYLAPSNTGIPSGLDFNNDGTVDGADDAYGFGFYPGQYGMVLLSKYPIDNDNVRTFQNFLWKDMPGALLPNDPSTPKPNDYYSEEELEVFRLSSKSHWDIPIEINGETVHILASHPTPPVFDGEEDRNGKRNHDEIRFWADYITPGENGYIYDDEGNYGGLPTGESFVIAGDQNADPFDGDSTDNAILQLLDNPLVNTTTTPVSQGGVAASKRQNQVNDTHQGNPAYDTADFNDESSGNLRADYVLLSQDLEINEAKVFWPVKDDPLFELVGDYDPNSEIPNGFPSSDHRLVYADVKVSSEDKDINRQNVTNLDFLGEVTFPTGFSFAETEVGGISGLTYNAANDTYYALSDDRSTINDARFYDLAIALDDGSLDEGDVEFEDVTTLLNTGDSPFSASSLDPEGIAATSKGTLYISSEGDADNLVDPFIGEFSLDGEIFNELPIPDKFLPTADGSSGIRNNLAFESLTITPDERYLFTATENALNQDGETVSLEAGSPVRILQYDLKTGEEIGEFLYETDPIPVPPEPADDFADNGLVELLAIDNTGTFLALERSFAAGVGNNIRLYQVNLQGATDISSVDGLLNDGETTDIDAVAKKKLLLDFSELGITLDNSEAVSFGETLPDGRQSLIVASDNNFSEEQKTQFLAFAIDTETIPSITATAETPDEIRYDLDEPEPEEGSDSDDPAIYIHPKDPENSFVITAMKNGGLRVYDLEGQELQSITPENIRYNNVDLAYGVEVQTQFVGETVTVDLAIASDRANDTLAIFAIDPETKQLTKYDEGFEFPESIFGVDDGEATAYGLATYKGLVDGKTYAFVSQADGNKIAQLEITPTFGAADEPVVNAKVVRTIEVPVPEGETAEDAQVEGMVVDRETGDLYVGQEGYGIWKYSAEPNGSNEGKIVDTVDDIREDSSLTADVEGLSIYYGEDGNGYLLASSQGDSTFAIYDRAGSNSYLGSFAIEDSKTIDGVEESDGADITNVPLGDKYPAGLLVVQDGSNEPAAVFPDPEDGEIQNFNTNFKYVSLVDFADIFPNLPTYNPDSFDPRQPEARTLINGVASGDTTKDSTVLWTRSNVLGNVTFEYATDPDFNNIIGTETAEVTDTLLPVKVNIANLNPDTDYYYRVTDAAGDIETGTFATSAAVGTKTGLHFGVSGDWRGELKPYPVIRNADNKGLEFFVEHGDTIYADVASDAVKNPDGTRKEQARTIDEYRAKHSEVYANRLGSNFWDNLRSSTSILATIDDHEVTNDFAGGATASSDDRFAATKGLINDTQLFENGLQAFQEYNPLQDKFYGETGDEVTAEERQLYRYNTYGSDAATFVLDTRSFRDAELTPPEDITNPAEIGRVLTESQTLDRTLLGEQQLEDLKQDLKAADEAGVTWKFIMIPEPIQNLFPGINVDSYEGYLKERAELLSYIDENNIDNVVFVAADVHMTAVNNLTYQTKPFGEQTATNAFEVTTGAITYDPPTGEFLADLLTADNPELQATYDSLPVAPDLDNKPNDKDDFIKQAIDSQLLDPLGFDPIGLDNNLSQADGLIDAELLQGDYYAGHTYGWTEFDIDRETQQLRVTTYGVDAYSEEEILANPNAINSLVPQVVSEFVVNPAMSDI
ncbi:phytase [Myxosarcina sp. GI1]|uniref:phytase n=1 Tax=Myxosarcina sp. GI1 TaxID=1541065 RepID=UPI00068A2841|nr:phytase [Myxosarcina sp. GI1]